MIAGAVLTGGRSSRFGKDKCSEILNGKPLVEIAYLKLKQVVDEVFIVGKDYGLGRFLPDSKPHMGPLYALYGLLEHIEDYKGVIVLPCDMPLVPVGLIRLIADVSRDYDIVVPEHNGFKEPLVAYYDRKIKPHVENLLNSGHLSVKRLFDLNLRIRIIDKELRKFGDPSEYFINVNYPEDLERLR